MYFIKIKVISILVFVLLLKQQNVTHNGDTPSPANYYNVAHLCS